ncbi:hypothetical protein SAMN06265379_11414 [Saccharicrinis carchari]|uniref:Uncharacterized protein n=1 Tax=Saccharicrinis carchari TaxID=1168039 RepID=A0A521F437_SACCC|nr:hypothetical protein [Saccharicrinis carchari]SMO90796.1 hypothetical protein SAMN06265379_11414 [Saccharicrinis carchari]
MNRFKATVARLKQESEQRKILSAVNNEWVVKRLAELGLSRQDLIRDLMLDKSSLSLYLRGNRKMNKSTKAAFFYYFAFKESVKSDIG